jgi:hypothetical protein
MILRGWVLLIIIYLLLGVWFDMGFLLFCLLLTLFIVFFMLWVYYLALWRVSKTKVDGERFRRV